MLFLTRTFALSPVRVVLSAVISSSVHGFRSLRLASFRPMRKTRWALLSQQQRARSKVLFPLDASTARFLQRRRAAFIFTSFPERTGFCLPIRVPIRKILLSPDPDFSTGHAQPSASLSPMTISKLLTRFLMHFTKSSNQPMKLTAPCRSNFSDLAIDPCRGLSLSR
jgi:hypothetical protein